MSRPSQMLQLPGWDVEGPEFKGEDYYLSRDGDNPEAPWPGYGWPLGTKCWYFILNGYGRRLFATGLTVESATARAKYLANQYRKVELPAMKLQELLDAVEQIVQQCKDMPVPLADLIVARAAVARYLEEADK